MPGGEVHHAPTAIEVAARPVAAPNRGDGELASGEVALDGGLERGGGGIGHDPGDEATVEFARCAGELDDVHLGPESAGQWRWWGGPGHVGLVCLSAERGEEAVGGRVARRDHGVQAGSRAAKQWMSRFDGVAGLVLDLVEAGGVQHVDDLAGGGDAVHVGVDPGGCWRVTGATGDGERAARSQDPGDFGEGGRRVGHEVDGVDGDRCVALSRR